MVKKKTKRKKKILTPEEKKKKKEEQKINREKKKFKTDINTVFINSGFTQIPTRNHNFSLNDREGEIDNIFLYENIIVLAEDTTTSGQDSLKVHIKKTQDFYEYIMSHQNEFIELIANEFPKFKEAMSKKYINSDYKIISVYCSRNKIDEKYQNRFDNLKYLNYPYLQYFLRISKAISRSTKYELFKFLNLSLGEIGHQESGKDYRKYEGFLLPESPSGFPEGYKIVSFLIEPQRLIEQSYVLRQDSWRDTDCLYQRLLIKNKIVNMRKYLKEQKRVFVNNIIVTLPDDTKLVNDKNKDIPKSSLNQKQKVNIELKRELNTLGIIDGQHRVFTYHEGLDKADEFISVLRDKQHLQLTGIIYPPDTKDEDKIKFEAKLFLEINDKQTRAKGDLKQAIETLINPYSSTAIAKSTIQKLGQTGPLVNLLEEHFYDRGKIKTTSIVSYGMKHIVSPIGENSFINEWDHSEKKKVIDKKSKSILNEYVDFCAAEINKFLGAFKNTVGKEMWVIDKKKSAVLRTTTINGLIFCIRILIENKKLGSFDYYKKHLEKLNLNFDPEKFDYKSSHWKDLGEEIYNQCFK